MADQPNFNDEAMNEEPMKPMEEFFYHQRRGLEEAKHAVDALVPPEFKEHSSKAGKEFVRGFQVLVDAAIDELKKVSERAEDDNDDDSEENKPPPPSTTGKSKVKVEVD